MVLRLTSTHVKTRRLFYLYKLSEILESKGPMQQKALVETIKQWAEDEDNKSYFDSHVDPTGEISTPDSGERYLNFSKQLGLIISLENNLVNAILGNVLSKMNMLNLQPYKLSLMSKCLLLKRLLSLDFDYLTTVAWQLINRKTDFASFKEYLREHFDKSYSPSKRIEGTILLKGMKFWKSGEEFYKEHIFAPRKAWFIDLEMVNLDTFRKKSEIFFSPQSRRFLTRLWHLQQKEIHNFLENQYYGEFASLFGDEADFTNFSDMDRKSKRRHLFDYLERAFSLFGSRYLRRISSKAFFEYTLCHTLCNEKTICTRRDLENALLEISGSKTSQYRYRKVEEISENGVLIDAGYITAET